jgi:hypothetical protein
MKTLNVYSNGKWEEVVASPAGLEDYAKTEYVDSAIAAIPATDLSGYYTKPETDAAIKVCRDEGALDLDAVQNQVLFAVTETARQLQVKIDLKADKADTYTKVEVDGKFAPLSTTTLITTQLQAVFDSIYTRVESDDRYAAKQDKQQSLITKTVVSQAYGFGDTLLPSVALGYIDTGEGYGNRLVLNVGADNELLVYKSDLEPLNALLPRIETLESKAAPVIDLAPYVTLATADTRYGRLEALDLLRNQVQTIFDSIYTRAEADFRYPLKADVYTQKQTDDRFMRIDQAFSKTDFDNQMALMLYSRKQVDDKLTAISPLGSPTINNPALADFKKSVLDEVKLMLVGGTKMPPPDIDWTWMVRMDGAKESVSTEIQARMIGGFIELKGTLSFGAGSGSWVPLRLPPQFPVAEVDASYPLAMRLVGTAVTYGFCSVSSKNRDISCSPGARSSEANFSGIRWKAAY